MRRCLTDVRLFAPAVHGGVRELVPEAVKPKMTAGRAAIIKAKPEEDQLLKLMDRWRHEAIQTGREIERRRL